MKTDKFGEIVFTEQDICNLYLANSNIKLQEVLSEVDIPNTLNLSNFPKIKVYANR